MNSAVSHPEAIKQWKYTLRDQEDRHKKVNTYAIGVSKVGKKKPQRGQSMLKGMSENCHNSENIFSLEVLTECHTRLRGKRHVKVVCWNLYPAKLSLYVLVK